MKTYEIGLEIHSKSEDAALRQTEQRLGDIAKKQHEAAAAAEKHTSTLRDLSSAIAGIVGSGAFLSWLQKGTAAAIEQERTLRQLSAMATQFGQDGAKAARAAEALGNSLQKVGYDDDEVLKSIQQILPLTRDYEQAISAVSLAYDIATRKSMSVGEAISLLQPLIAGQERGLNPAIKALGVEATTTQEALAAIEKEFRGAASTLDDTKAKISAAKAELDDFGKLVGGPVAQALVFLIDKIKNIGFLFGAVGLGSTQFFRTLVTGWSTVWDAVRGKVSVADIRERFAELKREFTAEWEAWADDVEEKTGAVGGGPAKVQPIKGRPGSGGGGGGAAGDAYEQWLKTLSKEEQEVERRRNATFQRQNALRDREVARQKGLAALGQQLRDQAEADEVEKAAARAAREMAERDEKVKTDALLLQLGKDRTAAELAMEEEAALVKKQLQEEAIAGSISALAGAFPQFKAFAVAEAIMSTYQGAARALAEYPPPYSFIAAAAQIAAGMAHVQKILSTEPGTGGGGGSGGAAASYNVSGRMTTSQPYAGGGGAKNTTNNYNSTSTTHKAGNTQINLTTLTASESARSLTELSKAMPTGERAANRQMATPQRIKIGSNRNN